MGYGATMDFLLLGEIVLAACGLITTGVFIVVLYYLYRQRKSEMTYMEFRRTGTASAAPTLRNPDYTVPVFNTGVNAATVPFPSGRTANIVATPNAPPQSFGSPQDEDQPRTVGLRTDFMPIAYL